MCMVDTVSFGICYKKENVTVTVEVPKQPGQKAQQELYGRLKEFVLESLEFMEPKPESESQTAQGTKGDI